MPDNRDVARLLLSFIDELDRVADRYDADHVSRHGACAHGLTIYQDFAAHVTHELRGLFEPDPDEWDPSRRTIDRWDREENRIHTFDRLNSPVTGKRDPRGRKKKAGGF